MIEPPLPELPVQRDPTRRATSVGRPRRVAFVAAVALIAGSAVGCGSDGPTGPAGRVARLAAPAGAVDTVTVDRDGDSVGITVRAEDAAGAPVEGVDVRFLVSSGGGSLTPPTSTTDTDGDARTTYSAGGRLGPATIRADVPSAPDVSPLVFTLERRSGMPLAIRTSSGADQTAEARSQLPRPLEIQVVDSLGDGVARVGLEWSLERAPPGAELRPLSTVTDTGGGAGALLTLGEAGEHVVRVRTTDPGAADTARIRATAVGSLAGDVTLDSVRPLPLVPGVEATLFGSGLGSSGAGTRVWVDGLEAEILEGGTDRLRVRVPASPDRCLPDRRGGIRPEVDGTLGNGLLVPIRGRGHRVDLSPGRVTTVSGSGAVGCLQLPVADRGREYRLVIQSASQIPGAISGLRLELRTGVATVSGFDAGGVRIPSGSTAGVAMQGRDRELEPLALAGPGRRASAARALPRPGAGAGRLAGLGRPGELLIRRRALEAIRRSGARPLPPRPNRSRGGEGRSTAASGMAAASGTARASVVPRVGEIRRLNFAVAPDLSISCEEPPTVVTARVRTVGSQGALLADTAVAGAGFSDADFDLLSREFSRAVFPTDTAYFGAPADIDGNERVLVLFTPEVNRLTPPGAQAAVGGFFLPLDLVESGSESGGGITGPEGEICPASNEAEILYLPVPDPQGRFGPRFSREDALRNARAIGAHELEHLLSTEQRVVLGDGDFTDVQELWLDEGLAHLAEEVVGFAAGGMSPGENLSFAAFSGSRDGFSVFNSFHLQNFGRLQLYLVDPAEAPVLARMDPGGVSGLRMRGFTWLFVRWLADQFAQGDEADFIRGIATGGPGRLQGIEAVTAATGRSWDELIEDFGATPVLDDRELPQADPSSADRSRAAQVTTWNLRALYDGLQSNPGARDIFPVGYPLAVTPLPFEDGRLELDVAASTARYLGLAAATGSPALALRTTDVSGGPPPAPVRILLVRLR